MLPAEEYELNFSGVAHLCCRNSIHLFSPFRIVFVAFLFFLFCLRTEAQNNTSALWHGKERTMHYQPDGNDFICVNPYKKFNKALYGGNTAFRVESGDLPEFALYMPGMGGNCKIGFVKNKHSKWLSQCNNIKTVYKAGSMLYDIQDEFLGSTTIHLSVLSLNPVEGMIVQLSATNLTDSLQIVVLYGGASGKKFSRDGDIGADPESSFYLHADNCKDNIYTLQQNSFRLQYGFSKNLSEEQRYEIQYGKPTAAEKGQSKELAGIFPANSNLQLSDALQQNDPLQLLQASSSKQTPVVVANFYLSSVEEKYFTVYKPDAMIKLSNNLTESFAQAEQARKKIASQISIHTPDKYLNPLGAALSIAADAIWEEPSFMHGAIAWRMRLPAWRGAYCADVMGWHDRAKQHFSSYAKSQTTVPNTLGIVADSALHNARQLEKMGTQMFSDGYICRNPNGDIRPHHYDMNLVFIDQLLNHFLWTGDTAFVQQMFPIIKKHLAWEKQNFDADGDGLYDAYACIWASDALQYSGGGVAHSSAYNYRANAMAAQLATLIGESSAIYEKEAAKIKAALNKYLWLEKKGWLAEYKDLLGNKGVHESAGLWTVYHAAESGILSPLQKIQMMQYVDNNIPHIPVKVKGYEGTTAFVLSTTNWQPYTWSINNVVLSENVHTALAYWQSSEKQKAYQLFKTMLVESMYASAAPGNLQQLSFYDAVRGELYRDFADGVGITARTLVEGLFGIQPNVLKKQLLINPGFPKEWNYATINLPDIFFDFKKDGSKSVYTIRQNFATTLKIQLQIDAMKEAIASVKVNGVPAKWYWIKDAINQPQIMVEAGEYSIYNIEIIWAGKDVQSFTRKQKLIQSDTGSFIFPKQKITFVKDPQKVLSNIKSTNETVSFIASELGKHIVFIGLKQGEAEWVETIELDVQPTIEILQVNKESSTLSVAVVNNSSKKVQGNIFVNNQILQNSLLKAKDTLLLKIPVNFVYAGSNLIEIKNKDIVKASTIITDWGITPTQKKYETINIANQLNDKVSNIFKNKYLAPRANTVTLQIPWQGIGNWCYPLTDANINDSGLLKIKGALFCQNIPFNVNITNKNILFTSLWNNYPVKATIPVEGNASHAYLLMAGSTNHQQSHFTNGKVIATYTDGSKDSLLLINPINWYPIEQDYYTDGFAFTTGASKPYRLLLKSGEFKRTFSKYSSIKGFSNYAVDGGAATVLDMPLNKNKTLQSINLITTANEVVIGLMAITLVR